MPKSLILYKPLSDQFCHALSFSIDNFQMSWPTLDIVNVEIHKYNI